MRAIMFILPITLVFGTLGYVYLRCTMPFVWVRSWQFVAVYLLLAANTVLSRLVPSAWPGVVMQASGYCSGLWIALMFYTILAGAAQLLLYIAGRLSGVALPHGKIALLLLVCGACFTVWGAWRAQSPVLRQEKIVTSKLPADSSCRVLFLTDLHLGQVNGRAYSERLVRRVNALEPDLIVIAGDILDEQQVYVDKQGGLEPLKELRSKYGVYMCYGNHDYIDRPELWQKKLQQAGIRVLRDKSVIVDGRIKLTGLEDYSRRRGDGSIFALSDGNDKYYSILLDHQPRRFAAAQQAGYDLYLAGHTHTGQLWPNRWVTRRMYLLDYGRAEFGAMTAVTSGGYGYWGPPVRTETAPEYVLLELCGSGSTLAERRLFVYNKASL